MSEVKVNKISPRTACGTVTLGDSGDTIAIGAGVTTSGMGRTGTVDWVTTPKVTGDSPITAATGSGYFLNTTAGTITINLPAGAAGSIVSMADYARTWNTNNVTVAPNGSEKIGGEANNATLSTVGQSVTFVYIDSTQGWVNVQDSTSAVSGSPPFPVATGGNAIVTCGDYKLHVFTGPGTFCVSGVSSCAPVNAVDWLVIAGGGSGGARSPGNGNGGGGAGGYRESPGAATCYTASPLGAAPAAAVTVAVDEYPIAVGGGGPAACGSSATRGNSGSVSSFSTYPSAGGGEGGAGNTSGPLTPGGDGGSGGGAGGGCGPSGQPGGTGNTPSVNPAQGRDGGTGGNSSPDGQSGGGGGAGAVGGNAAPNASGVGGDGVGTGILGSTPTAPSYGTPGPAPGRYFAGGGGGGDAPNAPSPASGGTGGGGTGMVSPVADGDINTGGGGGGATFGSSPTLSGAGGSGIVILRYKYQ